MADTELGDEITSGVKVIDFDGGTPFNMEAGSLKSGNGSSFASSPGFGGVYIVGGSGIVIVPGGSSLSSVGLLKPLSVHSSVSPSSTDPMTNSCLAGAHGAFPPAQQDGRHAGEHAAAHGAAHIFPAVIGKGVALAT